jgi:hypothetical protein
MGTEEQPGRRDEPAQSVGLPQPVGRDEQRRQSGGDGREEGVRSAEDDHQQDEMRNFSETGQQECGSEPLDEASHQVGDEHDAVPPHAVRPHAADQ